MKLIEIVEDQIQSLSTGSKSRLQRYRRSLHRDFDDNAFDDRLRDFAKQYARDKRFVDRTTALLDSCVDKQPQYAGVHYSRSSKRYSDLQTAFEEFSKPDHPSCAGGLSFRKAYQEMQNIYCTHHLVQRQYRNWQELDKDVAKKDAHAGFSRVLTGKKYKGDYLNTKDFHEWIAFMKRAKQTGSFNRPILCATRTQGSAKVGEGTCKHKTRLVNMVDVFQIFSELTFSKPFQDFYKNLPIYAGGKSDVEINDWVSSQRMKHFGGYYLTIDYSHFDETQSGWLIEHVFELIKGAFRHTYPDDFDDALWEVVTHDFIHKVFITADGLVESHKGTPSGSMFTQIVDSMVNELMIRTYMVSRGITNYDMCIMGDDNLIVTSTPIDREDLASYLMTNFGVIINAAKCEAGRINDEGIPFLSREYTRRGVRRDPVELISRMLYPERRREYDRRPDEVKVEYVFLAYCLGYPVTMRELFDVERFKNDYNFRNVDSMKLMGDYLPGYLGYIIRYEGVKLRV